MKCKAKVEAQCQMEEEAERWRVEELCMKKVYKEAEKMAKKRVSGDSTALTMY